jgi:hypothetical protein
LLACYAEERKEEAIPMATYVQPKHRLKGITFAAQACSCACDPCACGDRCTCEGADAYIGPRWRFLGDVIESGTSQGVDLSHRILLNFAQTSTETAQDWHEAILIDDGTAPQQVDALLQLFQKNQGSELAHPDRVPVSQRDVYLVPMKYRVVNGRETLSVTCVHDRIRRVRGEGQSAEAFLKEWTYNGHVAVQKNFEPED